MSTLPQQSQRLPIKLVDGAITWIAISLPGLRNAASVFAFQFLWLAYPRLTVHFVGLIVAVYVVIAPPV